MRVGVEYVSVYRVTLPNGAQLPTVMVLMALITTVLAGPLLAAIGRARRAAAPDGALAYAATSSTAG